MKNASQHSCCRSWYWGCICVEYRSQLS